MVYGGVVIGGVATTSGVLVSTVFTSEANGTTRSGSAELVPLDTAANTPIESNAPEPIVAAITFNCFAFTNHATTVRAGLFPDRGI